MSDISLETKVEILRSDVTQITDSLKKLDIAIDKIADATGGISKILAVHDQSIVNVQDTVRERKRLAEKETELLHHRISDMKDESSKWHKENHKEVMDKLQTMSQDMKSELKEVKERVTILERWKWWVMGGSWVIGFVIATILQAGGIIQLFMN